MRGLLRSVGGGLAGLFAALFLVVGLASGHIPGEQAAEVQATEAQGAPAQVDVVVQAATLESRAGAFQVGLPHQLLPRDYDPEGSKVHYRLTVFLPHHPHELADDPLAVMITKMALSGSLTVNGVLVGNCGPDRLENLRCLHQPQLFVPPPDVWQRGLNQIDLTIYATSRQTNGLSRVRIANLSTLQPVYKHSEWTRVELPLALTWMSVAIGLLALTLGMILKRQTVYLWFGLTALANAVSTINIYTVTPGIPIHLFNWLVFSARMVSVPFFTLTLLAIFNKSRRWINRLCVSFVVMAPLAIWLSGNSRLLTIGIYVPWLVVVFGIAAASVFWAARSRRSSEMLASFTLILTTVCGVMDWLKTAGFANFETVYLLPYAFGGALVLMGASLVLLMGTAYGATQLRANALEEELSHRIAYEVTRNIPIGTFSLLLPAGAHRPYFFFVSERFKQLTGRRFAAGKDVDYLANAIHPQDRERWIEQVERAIADHAPLSIATRIVDGTETRWVSVEAVPRHRMDGTTFWAGIVVDETEKVQAREAAEQNRAALQQSMIEQSRLREREELLRDMHDGFGSQLAGLRMQAKRGDLSAPEMSALLEDISADLHLVVDTMGHTSLTLDEALADMRYRVGARLGTAASRLRWRIDLAGQPPLEPRTVLHILRIVQEALHNALRHAGSELIEIGAQFDPQTQMLKVWVRDQGPGLAESYRPGRGLNNMRQRAREMGAELRIENWRFEENEESTGTSLSTSTGNHVSGAKQPLSGTEVVLELAVKHVTPLD